MLQYHLKHGAVVIERRLLHSSPYKSLAGKRTYTVEEIAKILGIGRTAAYSLVHSGVFKAVRIGSSIRVSKVSFDDWLDKQNM